MNPQTALVLVRTLADLALFLEFTGADQLDEDASVEALEAMAANLQDLPAADRQAVIQLFQTVAKTYPDSNSVTFVASLPEMLGLT